MRDIKNVVGYGKGFTSIFFQSDKSGPYLHRQRVYTQENTEKRPKKWRSKGES